MEGGKNRYRLVDHPAVLKPRQVTSIKVIPTPDHDFDADGVLVTFAWRQPTRDGGSPGKFAVVIDGATLEPGTCGNRDCPKYGCKAYWQGMADCLGPHEGE